MSTEDAADADELLDELARRLLEARAAAGHWRGELSASALSTATASFALRAASRHEVLTRKGLDWLAAHQNADGGWGDTVRSRSNISTTVLCWCALGAEESLRSTYAPPLARAERWIAARAGRLEPARLAAAIREVYGEDRTFSVPILTMAALAGRLGAPRQAWRHVPQLPFELAALPRGLFRHLGLPVVSYALPALIAIGQARFRHRRGLDPLWCAVRAAARGRTLRVLERLQPQSGGFLEATPLTSFVAMSLASIAGSAPAPAGAAARAVLDRCVRFLAASARADGSWPIDSDLATWVTTLSVDALASAGLLERLLTHADRARIRDWLLAQQHRGVHRYTGAAPGGWAWTDLTGGVPDADDTAGALIALHHLADADRGPDARVLEAAANGARWLLDLQNRDGGVPTFCRGWGKLPFDRSAPDLSAHALRALAAWLPRMRAHDTALARRIERAIPRLLRYLRSEQLADGAWRPLWFGNEAAPGCANLTYGTARVVTALADLDAAGIGAAAELRARGTAWLVEAQSPDGGWGGAPGVSASVEETALAVEALAAAGGGTDTRAGAAIELGVAWLARAIEAGALERPAPIGFYFARLWYWERLYPLIFSTAALGRAGRADATV